jgi:alpha-tubulin suppressor-like RCC1 family protein
MIGALTTWTHINLGYDFGVGRLSDGTMMGFGYNQYGATGTGDTGGVNILSPKLISGTNWATVSCGDAHFLAIKGDGTLWGSGCNTDGQIGNLSSTNVSTPVAVGSSTWSQVSAGMYHSLGIRANGNLFAWGYNAQGSLGQGNTINRTSPVRVGLSTWLSCAAGNNSSIAVRGDGTLWAWGYVGEWYSTSKLSSPVQIGSDTDWASVRSGDGTHLAQKTNGNVYGFGISGRDVWDYINNSSSPPIYMLAQNTEAIVSTPVQVGSATNWRSVTMGNQQGFGIKTDGTLWQWGWIIYDFTNYYAYCRFSTPVQVGVATTWSKVASCGSNILGMQTDGTIYGWGSGQPGLGINVNNSNGDTSTPVLITSPATSWIDIACAADCGLAIANDGTLYSWGYAEAVRGKTGGTVPLTPVSTATSGWSKVAAGTFHALGIKTTGTLWAWGDNPDGPLGINNTASRSTPIQVGSATDWHAVFAGGRKSMGTKGT